MVFNGKCKALTFSFDDGVEDDIRLIKIMNKYGLKGTFNLNSGKLCKADAWFYDNRKTVRKINYFNDKDIYNGHEVACHGHTHADMTQHSGVTLDNEIRLDKYILEYLFDRKIRGMAYAFGTYNDAVINALKENNIEYCRTVENTNEFSLPENPLVWKPTCHFRSKNVMDLAEKFVYDKSGETKLFYIWGHSYELVTEEDWQIFEELCKYLSGRDDVCYCTNIEILDCIK